ncbi:MAG: helix-turn-helix domain-containing protein [Bacteroidota bacterium]|nr:helix-turn-helix domain-containing protein [Bacteroidota bacterium]
MILYIRHMVCQRCIESVLEIFSGHGFDPDKVLLGEVHLDRVPDPITLENIDRDLTSRGFELINDEESQWINRIKSLIIDRIHHSKVDEPTSWSELIASELGKDYAGLSRLFSQKEGHTIEQFIIRQKVERAKELLTYRSLSIKEIAFDLGYSSPAHLSTQFKQVTGMTPSQFRALGSTLRTSLDQL